MLPLLDMLDAIIIIIIFTFGCVFGSWVFIKSRKEKIRLLSVAGVFIFFSGFQWIGHIIDIFTVFLTGHNMDNPFEIKGICILPPLIIAVRVEYINLFRKFIYSRLSAILG